MKNLTFSLVTIGEAAIFYGVSVATMRRWDRAGTLKPYCRVYTCECGNSQCRDFNASIN